MARDEEVGWFKSTRPDHEVKMIPPADNLRTIEERGIERRGAHESIWSFRLHGYEPGGRRFDSSRVAPRAFMKLE
jgi:hypothetical protein